MVYERNNRNRDGEMDYGRNYGFDRDHGYGGARDHAATEANDRGGSQRAGGYGGGGYGRSDYGRNDTGDYGRSDHGRSGYGGERGYGQSSYRQSDYAPGGYPRDGYAGDRDRGYGRGGGDRGRTASPQGYDHDDRGFFARAGDEVRSWFGDDEAERRRDLDQRYDARHASDSDRDYGEWRRGQIAALDRDYDEYRRENQSRFSSEFGNWRTDRQGQRSSLDRVAEHMEVVGSDGGHVGTVDKVRGDNIILTRNDADAGGHHHSIPSRWIQSVDDKVTIRKTADEAKAEWKDVERKGAMFGEDDRSGGYGGYGYGSGGYGSGGGSNGPRVLGRSFAGTYDKDG